MPLATLMVIVVSKKKLMVIAITNNYTLPLPTLEPLQQHASASHLEMASLDQLR